MVLERRQARRLLRVAPLVLAAAGCAQSPEKSVEAQPPPPPEVDPAALCAVVAEVEDARAKDALAGLLPSLHKRAGAGSDRAAVFGASYAIVDEDARWKAFKAEREARPESVVGHLGECFTYAGWKMAEQAKGPCDAAAERLSSLALVDVALGDLARGRGDEAGARERYQAALAVDGTCVPARVRLARVEAATDPTAAVATYERALESWPACFSCAVERADLVEKSAGREAAVAAWEAALALAPEHAATVKRYAAAQAGRDDAAALAAYEKAIALGVADAPTHVAAAALAEKTGDLAKAITHVRAALALQGDDVATWRLLARLTGATKDDAGEKAALTEVLRLMPDDGAAHLTLARKSLAGEDWVAALSHLEQAAAVPRAEEQAAEQALVDKELAEVLDKLRVRKAGASGNVNRVVARVQGDVRKLYEQRKKDNKALAGVVEITVVTADDGSVQEVAIAKDSLGDPMVAAALVGNLRRATIVGGAKRYSFELEFQ